MPGGNPKWLPLNFGYHHDVIRAGPIDVLNEKAQDVISTMVFCVSKVAFVLMKKNLQNVSSFQHGNWLMHLYVVVVQGAVEMGSWIVGALWRVAIVLSPSRVQTMGQELALIL